MQDDRLLAQVITVFGPLPRPAMFIRGTCRCEECLEHEGTLQALVREQPSLEQLGNAGWDPICFASDAAFAYLTPALVRLVLQATEDYVGQFLFHFSLPERLDALDRPQLAAVLAVLDHLALSRANAIDHHGATDDLLRLRDTLISRLNDD